MNWDKFVKQIKELSTKVKERPDIIIGITRGGIIPARLLSTFLEVKNMYCISVVKKDEERKVVTDILDDINGKNILLVEDMLETGRSLVVVKKYLEIKGARVKTACLYIMPVSEIKPDFYLKEIKEVVKFPWEK